MKWWLIIWAIYVLGLSGVPCEALCQDEPTTTQQPSKSASDDHSHDAACSPFCSCATCHGCTWLQAPQLIGFEIPSVFVSGSVLSIYQISSAFEVPSRIWQPPRLD